MKITKRLAYLLMFLAVSLIAGCYNMANAQTIPLSIQLQGSSDVWPFCASERAGDVFIGVINGACQTQPPPADDPNALDILIGKYTSHSCSNFSTSHGQDFAAIFGSASDNVWDYIPSTGVSVTLPPHGRYLGAVFHATQNPGILPHYIKGDSYAGSCNPPLHSTVGARVNVRVIGVGSTPAPTGLCVKTNVAFDGNAWIQFKFAGPANTSHCLGQIGGVYRYIVENAGTTNILALLTYN